MKIAAISLISRGLFLLILCSCGQGIFLGNPGPNVSGATSSPNSDGTVTVTISGTGFVNGDSVTINGFACTSVNVISTTKLTCTLPSANIPLTNIVVTSPSSIIYASDSFTGADGTSLAVHSMDGGTGWTVGSGNWQLLNNTLIQTLSGPSEYFLWTDAGVSDGSVQIDATIPISGTGSPGLVARLSDMNNYWMLTLDVNNNAISIYENKSGALTIRAQNPYTFTPGSTIEIKFVAQDSSLTGYLSGVNVVSYSSASLQTNTRFGIREYQNFIHPQIVYDNFKVTPP